MAQPREIGKGSPGKKKKTAGPSNISRVFDILSRGQYASAEGVRRVFEKGGGSGLKDIGNFFSGAGQGVTGKKKTSYSHVLKEHGVKGPLAAIGGLAGDVLLDPTTYLTFGTAKAGEVALAKTVGARAAQSSIKGIKNIKKGGEVSVSIRKAGDTAATNFVETAFKAGTKTPSPKQVRNVAHEAMVRTAVEEAGGQVAKNAGSINMKFMGKQVGKSEGAYKGLAAVGQFAGKTQLGSAFNKTFRTAAKFPGMTNEYKRVAEQAGLARFEMARKEIDVALKGFTKADQSRVTRAIEIGEDLVGQLGEHGEDLGKLQQFAKLKFDELYQIEKGIGLFPDQVVKMAPKERKLFDEELKRLNALKSTATDPEALKTIEKQIKSHKATAKTKTADPQYLDKYVYHHYRKGTEAQKAAFKAERKMKAVGSEKPGFTQTRTLPTLENAKIAGLEPVEEIGDILKLRAAKHNNVTARANFVDQVVSTYGVKVEDKLGRKVLKEQGLRAPNSRFAPKDTLLPDNIARTLESIEKMHFDDMEATGFAKLFDAAQNQWKWMATTVNPGHHIRNMTGDIWLNWIDGVKNPLQYARAAKLLAPNAIENNAKAVFKIGKAKLTGSDIIKLYGESGARSGFYKSELGGKFQNKFQHATQQISEKREDWARLAHFIDALEKEGKNIAESGFRSIDDVAIKNAAAKASQRVRKWNIDYGDLTETEKRYFKRAMPFYTFARKNLPLQAEALFTKPGKILAIPKGTVAIQNMLGIEPESAVAGLENVPSWLRDMAPINLKEAQSGQNAMYLAPDLPFMSAMKTFSGGKQGMARNLVNMATPAAKIPFEQATGESIFSGAPNPGILEYLANQVPLGRQGAKLATGDFDKYKALNWLTGAGIQEATPAMRRSAQFEKREAAKKAKK